MSNCILRMKFSNLHIFSTILTTLLSQAMNIQSEFTSKAIQQYRIPIISLQIVWDSSKNHTIHWKKIRVWPTFMCNDRRYFVSSFLYLPEITAGKWYSTFHSIPSEVSLMLSIEIKSPLGCGVLCYRQNTFIMLEGWRILKRMKKIPLAFFSNQLLAWNVKSMRFTYKSKQHFGEWTLFYANEISEFPLSHSFPSAAPKVNCL